MKFGKIYIVLHLITLKAVVRRNAQRQRRLLFTKMKTLPRNGKIYALEVAFASEPKTMKRTRQSYLNYATIFLAHNV